MSRNTCRRFQVDTFCIPPPSVDEHGGERSFSECQRPHHVLPTTVTRGEEVLRCERMESLHFWSARSCAFNYKPRTRAWLPTKPMPGGKFVRFGAGRSRVRVLVGYCQNVVNWYCNGLPSARRTGRLQRHGTAAILPSTRCTWWLQRLSTTQQNSLNGGAAMPLWK